MAKSQRSDKAWTRLVARAEVDTFFLGSTLASYREAHGLTHEALAARLECAPSKIHRLALCRLPDDRQPRFREDIQRIAAYVPCNPDRLVELVREIAGLMALKDEAPESEYGMLLAARDRKKPPKGDPK